MNRQQLQSGIGKLRFNGKRLGESGFGGSNFHKLMMYMVGCRIDTTGNSCINLSDNVRNTMVFFLYPVWQALLEGWIPQHTYAGSQKCFL